MPKSKSELEKVGIKSSYNGGDRIVLHDGSEWAYIGNGKWVPFD
jgi:hypothetical protein